MLYILENIIPLYGSCLRRNREAYILHPIRVARSIQDHGLDSDLVLLGLLHDVLEINGDVGLMQDLREVFGLTQDQIDVLSLLTRNDSESSLEHFDRVLNSGNVSALIVKYFDCLDNSHFHQDDYIFTENVLNLNPVDEIAKYKHRSDLCKKRLASLGFILE